MDNLVEVQAELRTDSGKGASRRLRHAGQVPAIIYGGENAPVSLSLEHNRFLRQLQEDAFYASILTIKIDGKEEQAILKDLQRHPASDVKIMHADFLRVDAKQKITMNAQLHFIGEDVAPGAKLEGGVFSHLATDVEISCLPADLPEFIEIDTSAMALGDSIHLTEIVLPKGVELVALSHGDHGEELAEGERYSFDQAIVSLHTPAVAEEIEDAPAEAPEGEEEAEEAEGDAE